MTSRASSGAATARSRLTDKNRGSPQDLGIAVHDKLCPRHSHLLESLRHHIARIFGVPNVQGNQRAALVRVGCTALILRWRNYLPRSQSLPGPSSAPMKKPTGPATRKPKTGATRCSPGQRNGEAMCIATAANRPKPTAPMADQANALRCRSELPRTQNQKASVAMVQKKAKRIPDKTHGSCSGNMGSARPTITARPATPERHRSARTTLSLRAI